VRRPGFHGVAWLLLSLGHRRACAYDGFITALTLAFTGDENAGRAPALDGSAHVQPLQQTGRYGGQAEELGKPFDGHAHRCIGARDRSGHRAAEAEVALRSERYRLEADMNRPGAHDVRR